MSAGSLRLSSFFLSFLLRHVLAQQPIVDNPGFQKFVTRPELRPPKLNITTYLPDQIAPGYWFLSPYPALGREDVNWQWPVCPFGPHIIDGNGELVWSGACMVDNRNVFDFRVIDYQGHKYLSGATPVGHGNGKVGAGIILDDNYKIVKTALIDSQVGEFNPHEFNVINDGRSALATTSLRKVVATPELGFEGESRVEFNGFKEINLENNQTLFEWSSEGHITLDECTEIWLKEPTPHGPGWDYLHMNSVDKFTNGDYLISCRHTDAIYRIDGKDGHIIWRLGGKKNNFRLEGFNFSRQHHARILKEEGDMFTMSFLDNAAGNNPGVIPPTNDHSTGYVITVDERHHTAHVMSAYPRPDGKISVAKGDVQILPNTNVFVGWAEGGYSSEFLADGSLVQTLQFYTFSTYRAYKFEFVGHPNEAPIIKSFAYGASSTQLRTVIHVSWNGATEAKAWNFYGSANNQGVNRSLIGQADKRGFETIFMYDGYVGWVEAEALDKDGNVLNGGRSALSVTEPPKDWAASGFQGGSDPQPETNPGIKTEEDDEETGAPSQSGYLDNFFFVLVIPVACVTVVIVGSVWFFRKRRWATLKRYSAIPTAPQDEDIEKGEENGMLLHRVDKKRIDMEEDERFSSLGSRESESSRRR